MSDSTKTRKVTNGTRATKNRPAAKPARKSRRSATKDGAEHAVRPGTKQADLTALLKRGEGATIAQMCTKTRWQAHSVRAALTGIRKRGVSISSDKNNAGITVYRIVETGK